MEDAIPGERDASSVGLRKRCAAKRKPQISDWKPEVFYMPAVGLEPTRCCHQQILSLPRLPIPTHRHVAYRAFCPNIWYIIISHL